MKKIISALLAVLLLAAPVLAADEPDTLAARFDALRAEYSKIAAFAAREGLRAHASSVEIRFEEDPV